MLVVCQTCVIVKICMYKTLRIFDINFDPEDIVDEEDQQIIGVGLRCGSSIVGEY